jgi:hypothetical protein
VSKDIRRILAERARYFNIILEDVSITNLTFSREYTAAVEAKQVAQQEAERAKFIVSLSLWREVWTLAESGRGVACCCGCGGAAVECVRRALRQAATAPPPPARPPSSRPHANTAWAHAARVLKPS